MVDGPQVKVGLELAVGALYLTDQVVVVPCAFLVEPVAVGSQEVLAAHAVHLLRGLRHARPRGQRVHHVRQGVRVGGVACQDAGVAEMAVHTCHNSIKKHKSYRNFLIYCTELNESEFISLPL